MHPMHNRAADLFYCIFMGDITSLLLWHDTFLLLNTEKSPSFKYYV